MQIAPNNINDTRLQLRRLAERGIPVETGRDCSPNHGRGRPADPDQPTHPN
ncbi:hypothetical protein ACWDE0_43075 [Streptomyces sp. 900105755]